MKVYIFLMKLYSLEKKNKTNILFHKDTYRRWWLYGRKTFKTCTNEGYCY